MTPEYRHSYEIKKPLIEDKDGNLFPMRISTGRLEITTFGEMVVFTKSNRGQMFHDSRQKKPIGRMEFVAEIRRLLDNDDIAKSALYKMTGEWMF